MNGAAFSLYCHIPYCRKKCRYCDFNSYQNLSVPEDEYVSALNSELRCRAAQPEWRGRTIKTIYFGGGTPSLFCAASILSVLETAASLFDLEDTVEISLEANPGTVSLEGLKSLRRSGVNRLSIGVQTFNTRHMSFLQRIHNAADSLQAVSWARQAGFSNLNLDLIYGIPEQTASELEEDLAQLVELAPEHISAYALSMEKDTPLYLDWQKGKFELLPDDDVADMMLKVGNFLSEFGYQRYEISNYSKSDREARHNLACWNGDDYLGIGAGAHSYCRRPPAAGSACRSQTTAGFRWSNRLDPAKYCSEIHAAGCAQEWSENLSLADSIFEFFFLGLRKTAGISLDLFKERFSCDAAELYREAIAELSRNNLICVSGANMKLTDKGFLLADSVIARFSPHH